MLVTGICPFHLRKKKHGKMSFLDIEISLESSNFLTTVQHKPNLHIIKHTLVTIEKKPLRLSLPYLGPVSLQVRTKIRNAMISILNCSKLQVTFKSKRKLCNMFRFIDCVPYDLVSGVVYEYTCGRCNSSYYDQTERQLKVRNLKSQKLNWTSLNGFLENINLLIV